MMSTLINATLNPVVGALRRSGLLAADLDYHIVRASMVIMFFFFGYQKLWAYEVDRLEPFISNGPLIWWLYPAFGHQGATWFLGICEWTFDALLFAGFWDKRLGVLGAAGSTATFVKTVTIIPFMPDGWDRSAGGFPAMTGNVPFSDEGCRPAGCVAPPLEAGCCSPRGNVTDADPTASLVNRDR
jgi:uncharacterized membrane protein YkgB